MPSRQYYLSYGDFAYVSVGTGDETMQRTAREVRLGVELLWGVRCVECVYNKHCAYHPMGSVLSTQETSICDYKKGVLHIRCGGMGEGDQVWGRGEVMFAFYHDE